MEENTRKIQRVDSWNAGVVTYADHIQLYNFHNYNFKSGEDSSVSYRLFRIEELEVDETTMVGTNIVKHVMFEGSVALPYQLVAEWGEDDEPIFDYVISALSLVKDEEAE